MPVRHGIVPMSVGNTETSLRIRCAFSRACWSVKSDVRRFSRFVTKLAQQADPHYLGSQIFKTLFILRSTQVLGLASRRVNRSADGARRADDG